MYKKIAIGIDTVTAIFLILFFMGLLKVVEIFGAVMVLSMVRVYVAIMCLVIKSAKGLYKRIKRR